ncbi:UvrD-helicase domain protein [Rhizoctonia solani AG-3 Rhs1AP]|uniref:UvrD-helicase domain protein n=2 Tax=Rhizoctonia solani AG-3 TaxID=1086053 RepID=A0A074SCD4_9AGAM|nr:UvrD-helicase domain protein [Rhizoctonia solani AG-3 Rhs1AP]KEP54533.1 UvrD-helicase domain protein [Rhizoctonia solani 123E]
MSISASWRWPVVLSGRAIRELRQLTEDNKTLEIIRTKFKELSRAQFTTDNHLLVRGTEGYIPIYRARMSVDLRIIYMIDLVADSESKFDHQVIKIFSVSTRARVAYDFWAKVSRYLVRLGRDYRDRCTRREYVQTADGPLNIPAMFDHREYILAGPDGEHSLGDEDNINSETDMNELHEIVALEKFSPVTKSLYNSILADMEAVLPMALNPDERKIVRHHGTSIVIGRSGTGKTTALIYKMRANAQLGARSDELRPTRQLFVTRSKVLTQHIARNYQGLMDSSDIANKTTNELEEMRKVNQKYQARELVEYDNSVDFRVDLPRRFSELKDSHFPLFVSFDKLCELLEGDMMGATGEDALSSARIRARPIITFSEFKHQYWPSFNYKLTRNLNPALVFSEILGVIKGYGRNLTVDEYLSELSHKKSPLLMDVRDRVYAIYEAYTKLCNQRFEIDNADRTQKILSNYRVPLESRVDYMQVFIDEVQDHLMSDVYLLQSLCSNLDGGYWCGDTAQTINVGSSFRIKDLKAFIYEKMIPKEALRLQRKAAMPFSLFELTVNFRSHGGIVRYAASLVELIYTLFPTSIDVMAPETAKTPGLPPLLFASPEKNEAAFVHYLLDQKPIEQATPFGAQQAIIVRSEATARSLTQRLQKRCTVISLLETKGLEFDDILLYNFFEESEAPTSAWRAILSLSVHNKDGRVQFDKLEPQFTASPVLCSELKQLYVAITRARHRCWIWDSGETINAMKVLWEGLKLIASAESLSSLSKFAASTKDLRQWAQRGQEFFSTGLYALAQSCFERAGQDKEAAIADAYNTMAEAKAAGAKNDLIHAARKMETCANSEKSSHTASTLWYHAATCWHGARDIIRASRAYCRGGFYDQAAVISFEAQNMDECLKILVAHSGRMDSALVQRIEEVASVHFLRERRYDDLQKLYKGSLDQCIALARSLRFPVQLKELLQRNRQFEDLANEYLSDGLPVQAIQCLLKVRKPATVERAKSIVSSHLWMTFSLDATRNPQSIEQAEDLINICKSLGGLSAPAARNDIELFSILVRHQTVSLEMFESILTSFDPTGEEDGLRLTLIYHHALKANEHGSDSYEAFVAHLQAWPQYLAYIQQLSELPSPSQSLHVRRLLGLLDPTLTSSKSGSNAPISIPSGTFMQSFVSKGRVAKKNSTRDLVLPADTADASIREALAEHVQQSLKGLHAHLLQSPWTQPLCLARHGDASSTPEYPSQLAVQSQQLIQTLDLVFLALESAKGYGTNVGATGFTKTEADKIQTAWIIRLFNVIFAPTGSIVRAGLELLKPDFSGGIHSWVEDALVALDPNKHKQTFATLLVIYLSISSELHPNHFRAKNIPAFRGRAPVGCPPKPHFFAADISTLHQPASLGRLYKVVDNLGYIIERRWTIDATALIHLIERTTRDLILAERAVTTWPWFYRGFSGLVAPLSWASSLAMHAKYPRRLGPQPIETFVRHVRIILAQLLQSIPEHWKVLHDDIGAHDLESLTSRLIWSICLLAVNLHPAHPALPAIFNVLKDTAVEEETRVLTPLTIELTNLAINPDTQPVGFNQKLCLTLLTRTFHHEELVMLLGNHGIACPAKQGVISQMIVFNDIPHLRAILVEKLSGKGAESSAHHIAELLPDSGDESGQLPPDSPLVETMPNHQDAYEVALDTSPSRPETPVSLPDSESQDDEVVEDEKSEGKLTPEDAAHCIQSAWRRSVEREAQRRRLNEFDLEGRLYEEHRLNFPKMGKSATERDILALRLVRGPCLSIVLGLQMLIEEMKDYLEHIDDNLKAEGLGPKDVDELQKSNKKNQKLVEGYLAKASGYLPANKPPKIIKPGNISGVRTQTKNAWDVFMDAKNSKTVPQDEGFKEVEAVMLRGRVVIQRALEKPSRGKGR